MSHLTVPPAKVSVLRNPLKGGVDHSSPMYSPAALMPSYCTKSMAWEYAASQYAASWVYARETAV